MTIVPKSFSFLLMTQESKPGFLKQVSDLQYHLLRIQDAYNQKRYGDCCVLG